LSREGDGTASKELIDKVTAALQADDVRPLTDKVTVRGAEILRYATRATLVFFAGPDRSLVLKESLKRTAQYVADMHRMGMEVTEDGLFAAMRAPGVQKVLLDSPAGGVVVTKLQAAFCTSIDLIDGGVYNGSGA
jgi:phage-related baseplate assembly protein